MLKLGDYMKGKLFENFNMPVEEADMPHFEINGSKQFLADGCVGILHYDECCVRLSCSSEIVEICGCSLSLNHLGGDEAEVRGKIDTLRFI